MSSVLLPFTWLKSSRNSRVHVPSVLVGSKAKEQGKISQLVEHAQYKLEKILHGKL